MLYVKNSEWIRSFYFLWFSNYFFGWQQSQSPQVQFVLSLQQSLEHSVWFLWSKAHKAKRPAPVKYMLMSAAAKSISSSALLISHHFICVAVRMMINSTALASLGKRPRMSNHPPMTSLYFTISNQVSIDKNVSPIWCAAPPINCTISGVALNFIRPCMMNKAHTAILISNRPVLRWPGCDLQALQHWLEDIMCKRNKYK